MEVRFAASLCQCTVDVGNGFGNVGRCPALYWSQQDVIAVVIICNHEIIVALAGWLWQSSSLVGVHNIPRFCGGNEAFVCAGCITRLFGEPTSMVVRRVWFDPCLGSNFCASCVLAVCIQVSHGGGFKGGWEPM